MQKVEVLEALFEKFMLPKMADDASDVVQAVLIPRDVASEEIKWKIIGKRGSISGSLTAREVMAANVSSEKVILLLESAVEKSVQQYRDLKS